MRKKLIEMGITAGAVGGYMFYGQILVDSVKTYFGWVMDSWQLYASLAFLVIGGSYLAGKLVTRGMK